MSIKDEVAQLTKQAADWKRKLKKTELERQRAVRLLRTMSTIKNITMSAIT